MRSPNLTYGGIVIAVLLCVSQTVHGGTTASQDPGNAAKDYLRAIEELEKQPDPQIAIPGPDDPLPPDDQCRRIIARLEPALKSLHQATAKKNCDWENDLYRKGAAATFAHIPKSRDLAAGAMFRARFLWQTGKREPAIRDARAALVLARRVGDEGNTGLVGLTERYKIELGIVHVLRPWMRDAESARSLDGLFQLALQTEKNLPKIGLLLETETLLPWSRRLVTASDLTPEELKWRSQYFGPTLAEHGAPWIVQKIDDAKVHYIEVGTLMDLPLDLFIPKLEQVFGRLNGAGNPFSQVGLVQCPGIPAAYLQSRNLRAQWSILQAASGVLQSGPDAVKKFPDPFGKGPFHYEPSADGFLLRSALVLNQKPVELRFTKSIQK